MRPLRPVHLVALFLLHTALGLGLSVIIPGNDHVRYGNIGAWSTPWVRQFVIPLLIVLAVQLIFIRRFHFHREVWRDEHPTPRRWIVVFPLLMALGSVGVLMTRGLSDASVSYWIGIGVTMALVGLTEELTFRGVLLVGGRQVFGSERRALLVSSLLFGLFHLPNLFTGQALGLTLKQVLSTTVLGMAFYCLRRVTTRLWPAVALHALYDFALLQSLF